MIRPGEARALDVGDYDWKTRALRIEHAMKGAHHSAPRSGTKTGIFQVRDASDRLHDWLLEHVPPLVRRNQTVPLFRNPGGEGRWRHAALTRGWVAACTKAGVEIGLYNGTMHSTLKALGDSGVRIDVLQALHGHASKATTLRYAPIDPARARDALRKR